MNERDDSLPDEDDDDLQPERWMDSSEQAWEEQKTEFKKIMQGHIKMMDDHIQKITKLMQSNREELQNALDRTIADIKEKSKLTLDDREKVAIAMERAHALDLAALARRVEALEAGKDK